MTAWRRAQADFLADIAAEPTVAYRYEQLGLVYSQQQEDQKAEAAPLQAVRIDPRLTDSHVGLAQIYDRQHRSGQLHNPLRPRTDSASHGAHTGSEVRNANLYAQVRRRSREGQTGSRTKHVA